MNQEAPLSGKRIVYLDILKIIAAFMVCFYHLNMLDMGYYPGRFYLPNANRMIMNLGAMSVPLFFMVNGALLLRRPHSLSEIFIRFVRLCLMYVFWSIVIHGILSLIIEGRFVFHAKAFLMSGTSYTVHLWFLRTAAILTLLTPALYGLFMRKKRFLLYGMLLALLVFPFLYNYVLLAGRLLDIPAFFYLDRTGAGTLYSIVYFVLGKILSDHARSKRCTRTVSSFLLCCFLILCGWMLVTLEVTLWTNINHKVFDGVTEASLQSARSSWLLECSPWYPAFSRPSARDCRRSSLSQEAISLVYTCFIPYLHILSDTHSTFIFRQFSPHPLQQSL